jgi:hypothetical protein
VSREKPDSSSGGLSVQTLLISAVSAVAAAVIVPLFWEKGTVVATAMTPVIVALASEALRRPVERVSEVAPRVARRTATGVAVRRADPQAAPARDRDRVGARGAGPERVEPFQPLPETERRAAAGVSPEDPFGLRRPPRRSWWRLGLVTGLLAFVLAAVVVTASELTIFGGSVSGHRGRTTLFGGGTDQSSKNQQRQQQQQQQKSRGGQQPSQHSTPAPAQTAQPEATATPTNTPSATPSATPTVRASPQASPTP